MVPHPYIFLQIEPATLGLDLVFLILKVVSFFVSTAHNNPDFILQIGDESRLISSIEKFCSEHGNRRIRKNAPIPAFGELMLRNGDLEMP